MTAQLQRRSIAVTAEDGPRREVLTHHGFIDSPFKHADWSPAFIAFLAYIVAIMTFKLPVGTEAMAIAILTLPLEKRTIKLPPVAALTYALFAWCCVGLVTSDYPAFVTDSLVEFAKVGAIFAVGVNVVSTRTRFRIFAIVTTVLFCLFPARGAVFNYFIYDGTVQGRVAWIFIYSNPNDLAAFALAQLCVAVGLIAIEKKRWIRIGAMLGVAEIIMAMLLTQSRGALIGLGVFGLIAGRGYLKQITVKKVMLLLVLAGFIGVATPSSVWRRLSTIKSAASDDESLLDPELADLATRQDQSSSKQRLEIWRVARTVIAEHPIFGVGLGAYPEVHFRTAQRPGFLLTARGHRSTHSTYLHMMAENGLIGFAFFATLIVLTFKSSRKARKAIQARVPELAQQQFYMEMGLVGYLVAGIWGAYGTVVPTYMLVLMVYSGSRVLLEDAERINSMPQLQPQAQPQPQMPSRVAAGRRPMYGRPVRPRA